MSIAVHVIEADWGAHQATLSDIRKVVFIEEQNVSQELEWDGMDADSTHFLAVTELGDYIGCARLLTSGQIGRMAVLKSHRGTGVGALLLRAAVEAAKEKGFERVYLHAQTYAEAFYRKGGFTSFGKTFLDADIEHIAMDMKLPLRFTPSGKSTTPAVRKEPVRPTLASVERTTVRFDDHENCVDSLVATLGQAQRRICLLNPYLDHDLFDREDVAQKISQLARSAAQTHVQIIVFDTKLMIDRGHQLVELARRLDQKISIRVLRELARAETSSFVCCDQDAYWMLPSYQKYEGICEFSNPVTTKRLSDTFREAWEKSLPSPELRTLKL